MYVYLLTEEFIAAVKRGSDESEGKRRCLAQVSNYNCSTMSYCLVIDVSPFILRKSDRSEELQAVITMLNTEKLRGDSLAQDVASAREELNTEAVITGADFLLRIMITEYHFILCISSRIFTL